ncbi:DUF11 domain-containing protein [Nocardioides bizhenqiangii]|uniref:DUF11 domain-containing protein n=1 Tax=Nocardioides bizhenqiangii TaxID=3095076 RepID=A0ABZ0ZSR5_9ACTN|nr:DUF11 domain-containing protein [Nocardioides sp. HM61]WQQ27309.1 DUF11 domain-containing protein [Nocardioides sp. HM61]
MNIKHLKRLAVTVGATGLAVAGIHAAEADHNADPNAHPLPVIDYGLDEKAIVVKLRMTGDGSATMQDAEVFYGTPGTNVGNPPLLDIKIIDDKGAQAQHFDEWDPRWEELEGTTQGTFSTKVADAATGSIIFPFEPDLRDFRVTNQDAGIFVGSYDLAPAILEFCTDNPDDPDCTTDLSVAKTDSPDPAVAGESVTYTLTVTNHGPNPAQAAQVVDELPAGLTFASASNGCTAVGQEVTCDLGAIPSDTTRDVTITADIDPSLVYDAGAPVTVENTATVDNLAGDDSNGANNSDTEETLVVAEADVSIDGVTANEPLEVLIGEPADFTAKVDVSNAGPSSPIDAVLSRTTTSSAGLTITPADSTHAVTRLEIGSPQTIDDAYELTCTTPGVKTVTLSYELALKNSEDTDPDLTDNTASASFDIDCVVPIAINVRPQGFPNSINLNTDATLAALTTEAGEYGLPLDFDAATIEIDTVRWGVRSLLFNVGTVGGAQERHGRNHLERSYELDERTRDADKDGVMHFKPPGSGLEQGVTEGCLKGRYDAGGGQTYTFFGCDSVRIVPPH